MYQAAMSSEGDADSSAPAKDVCLLDEVSHSRVVLQVAAAKEEPRVEALDSCVAAVPLAQVHLCRVWAQGCQDDT